MLPSSDFSEFVGCFKFNKIRNKNHYTTENWIKNIIVPKDRIQKLIAINYSPSRKVGDQQTLYLLSEGRRGKMRRRKRKRIKHKGNKSRTIYRIY